MRKYTWRGHRGGFSIATAKLGAPYPGSHEAAHTGWIGDGGQDQGGQSGVQGLAVGNESSSFPPLLPHILGVHTKERTTEEEGGRLPDVEDKKAEVD